MFAKACYQYLGLTVISDFFCKEIKLGKKITGIDWFAGFYHIGLWSRIGES